MQVRLLAAALRLPVVPALFWLQQVQVRDRLKGQSLPPEAAEAAVAHRQGNQRCRGRRRRLPPDAQAAQ